jgi:phosphoserine phosphatase
MFSFDSMRYTTLAFGFTLLLAAAGCGPSEVDALNYPEQSSREVSGPRASDTLPSWNDGVPKDAIRAFVRSVVTPGTSNFVEPRDRIAVFDNDGTLWSEQPIYPQVEFTSERVAELVGRHPDWKHRQPYAALLKRDWGRLAASGEPGRMQLLAAAYAGVTSADFEAAVARWLDTARSPRFHRLYTELTYQPMLELITYLRDHQFKIVIVSGGGVDFMRPWTERVYGVPPEHVVGSRIKVEYDAHGPPVLRRLPAIELVDDRAGKPVGLQQAIGKRPLAAFGNSDGDFELLEWTTSGPGARLGMIVHHTDAGREWSYDRASQVGRLSRALDEAAARGWVVADMQRDWRVVFPFEL